MLIFLIDFVVIFAGVMGVGGGGGQGGWFLFCFLVVVLLFDTGCFLVKSGVYTAVIFSKCHTKASSTLLS